MGHLLSMAIKMQKAAAITTTTTTTASAAGTITLTLTEQAGAFGSANAIKNGFTVLTLTATGTTSTSLALGDTFQGAAYEFSDPEPGLVELDVYSNTRGYLYSASAFGGAASGTYTRQAGENITVTAYIYAPIEPPPPCFVAGTMIKLADGTEAPIETLSEGVELESVLINTLEDTNNVHELHIWSSNDLIETRTTSAISKFYPEEVYHTIIVNNGLLEATRKHIQLARVNNIWRMINMEHLAVGDYLYNYEGDLIEVTSIEINTEPRMVYKLTLSDKSHTYFANNILTHNIKFEGFE
jgi:hypothetical protein